VPPPRVSRSRHAAEWLSRTRAAASLRATSANSISPGLVSGELVQAWGGRVSDWRDPLDAPMARVAARYGGRVARSDVAMVEEVLEALGLARPRLTVVVVGSNGKTSTATYLSDLFTAAGLRTGLYTSPHIAYWGERVRVDDVPVDGARLVDAVHEVDARVDGDKRFRFFDLLTLAAAKLFAAADVDVAVYEAGIGGRADATRALRPDLVVLTSVTLEHTQLLGDSEEEILRHKLDVAPAGSVVVVPALPERLAAVAREQSRLGGRRLVVAEPAVAGTDGLPWYLARNWQLARKAAAGGLERSGRALPEALEPRGIYGRWSVVARDGIDYVLDIAHNPQAWEAFLSELSGRLRGESAIAVVALTRERSMDELVAAVAKSAVFSKVWATTTSVRATHDPELVATALADAGVAAESAPTPADALEAATGYAREHDATIAAFGSTFLVTDAMSWLGEAPAFCRHDAG
jgi:dihydrofolate synthase / folylpolyglutamate synthase